MKIYKANVRVKNAYGSGLIYTWVQVTAQNPIAAKSLFEAQYGRGNVISLPVVA